MEWNVSMEKKCTGFTLKMIAVITMFVDHLGATVFERMLITQSGIVNTFGPDGAYLFYFILRCIGRMAFPIYCFLLVEGLKHTRSCAKYLMRLLVFAGISEIPFDLAFNRTFFEIGYNNVFFTLFFGLLTIWAIDMVLKKFEHTDKFFFGRLLSILIFAAGALTAEYVFFTDYGAAGVICIFLIYWFYNKPMLGMALAVIFLGIFSDVSEFFALLMLIPISGYNGKRGPKVKYFFYIFYPAHLLFLSLICYGLGLGNGSV